MQRIVPEENKVQVQLNPNSGRVDELRQNFSKWLYDIELPRRVRTIPELAKQIHSINQKIKEVNQDPLAQQIAYSFDDFLDFQQITLNYYISNRGDLSYPVTQQNFDAFERNSGQIGKKLIEDFNIQVENSTINYPKTNVSLDERPAIKVEEYRINMVERKFFNQNGVAQTIRLQIHNVQLEDLVCGRMYFVLPEFGLFKVKDWVAPLPLPNPPINPASPTYRFFQRKLNEQVNRQNSGRAKRIGIVSYYKSYYNSIKLCFEDNLLIPTVGFSKPQAPIPLYKLIKRLQFNPLDEIETFIREGARIRHLDLSQIQIKPSKKNFILLQTSIINILYAIQESENCKRDMSAITLPIGMMVSDYLLDTYITTLEGLKEIVQLTIKKQSLFLKKIQYRNCLHYGRQQVFKSRIPSSLGHLLQYIQNSPNLQRIDLSENNFGDFVGVQILQSIVNRLKNKLQLFSLNIAKNELKGNSLTPLLQIIRSGRIVKLDISKNRFLPQHLDSIIKATQRRKNLQEFLYIENKEIQVTNRMLLWCIPLPCYEFINIFHDAYSDTLTNWKNEIVDLKEYFQVLVNVVNFSYVNTSHLVAQEKLNQIKREKLLLLEEQKIKEKYMQNERIDTIQQTQRDQLLQQIEKDRIPKQPLGFTKESQEEMQARIWREMEEKMRKEYEEKMRKEYEEKMRKKQEEKMRKEQEEKMRKEQEEKMKKEQEEKMKKEYEEKMRKEQEEKMRKKQEEKMRKEQEEKMRKEQEEKMRKEQEEKMRKEQEEKMRKEYEEKMRKEQEEKMRKEQEEKMRKEYEEKMRKEQEEKMRKEQEEKMKKEYEEKIRNGSGPTNISIHVEARSSGPFTNPEDPNPT